MTAAQLAQQISEKRSTYKTTYEGFPLVKLADGSESRDIPANALEGLNVLMTEINDLAPQYEAAANAERFAADNASTLSSMNQASASPVGGGSDNPDQTPQRREILSLGQRFIRSAEFKGRKGGLVAQASFDDIDVRDWLSGVETRATMTTGSDGYPPEVLRQPGVTFTAQRPVQIIDTIPMRPTSENAIKFMKETVFTNTAAAKTETGDAVEATLTYAESTLPIERVPVFIPVSEIQLQDEPGLQSIINERLVFMVRQVLDGYVYNGNGSPPIITGMVNTANIQSQARSTDPLFDAVLKAMNLVETVGYANPNVLYLHSTDWTNLRLTRTSDGLYILANPADPVQPRIWGLPVVSHQIGSAGTGLVADTLNYVTLVLRMGVDIAVSDSHASNFIAGILAIRATTRAGLEIRRGEALCKITGI